VSHHRAPIEPLMKVATLLQDYPELEEALIEIAPPFRKLRNPVLRRSVAKVTSLRQAAAVAQIDVSDLVRSCERQPGSPNSPRRSLPIVPPSRARPHLGSRARASWRKSTR
jgi:hypothetical protein